MIPLSYFSMKCPGWEKFKMFSVFCFLTELLDVVLLPGDVQEEHLLVLVLGEDLLLDPKTSCWGDDSRITKDDIAKVIYS